MKVGLRIISTKPQSTLYEAGGSQNSLRLGRGDEVKVRDVKGGYKSG